MGIKDSQNCDHCGIVDYIEHMFVHCQLLKGYWEYVFRIIQAYTETNYQCTETNILLGITTKENTYSQEKRNGIANHILLIAKMCISKFRYGKYRNIQLIFDLELEARKKYLCMQYKAACCEVNI